MLKSITLLAIAVLLLAPLHAGAQTKWFKYEGNPVLAPGPDTWDVAGVYPFQVIREDSLYVMWYVGTEGSMLLSGRATSPDGVTWTKDGRNPIFRNGTASWERAGAGVATVIRTGSQYKMWYSGDSISALNLVASTSIGYAFSSDGVQWQRSSANPLITTGSWYPGGALCPSVLGPDSSGGYKMWFQGYPKAHAQFQIGYATATDETTWTVRADPVFSWGAPGSWDDDKAMAPKVLFDGQHYEMFYCGERALNVDPRTHIGYATSPDGLTWTRDPSNPVLRRGATWDANDIFALAVVPEAGLYHMWYGGYNGTRYCIGYAVSPKGLVTALSADTVRGGETISITARTAIPGTFSFFALLKPPSGSVKDSVLLFDDGAHGDGLAGDGRYTGSYSMPNESMEFDAGRWSVDLKLRLHGTLASVLQDMGSFIVPYEPSPNAHWHPHTSGTTDMLWGVSFPDKMHGIAVGGSFPVRTTGRILRTTDEGVSWDTSRTWAGADLRAVAFANSSMGWVVGGNGTILRTSDGGVSWIQQTSGTTAALEAVRCLSASTVLAAGQNGSIVRTSDGGATWVSQTSPVRSGLYGLCFTDTLKGTAVGLSGTILRTSDGGTSWTAQTSGTTNGLTAVAFTDENTGTVVGTNGTILRTTDGGATWSRQASGVTTLLNGVCFPSVNKGIIVGGLYYNATSGVLLSTVNGGTTWHREPIRTQSPLMRACFTSRDTGFAVGLGGTILHTADAGVPVESTPSRLPQAYWISQNYPNPFNPTTTIEYALPRRSHVTLTVFNLLGQVVAELVNGETEAGYHEIRFDAASLASGVYFYRMEAGNFIQTRKLLLVR